MKKKFNTTGNCYPEKHYMMDNSKKFEAIMELVADGEYFTINHPRQYGKTTMLFKLLEALEQAEAYLPIALNFQGIDRQAHESDEAFGRMFVQQIASELEFTNPVLYDFLMAQNKIEKLDDVSSLITSLVRKAAKRLILLIDEVDTSSNYTAFLSFLGMLRNKYLKRKRMPTFYSVVLVSVHDIKNLKFKLRNPEDTQYNSPWNIAADFKVDLSFTPQEIIPMLIQYSEAEEVKMDVTAVAKRLYHHTSGYPFLISKICKNIVEDLLPLRNAQRHWTVEDVEASVQRMIKTENNTNFESLIKNLENHPDLYQLVFRVLINGDEVSFNPDNTVIKKGVLYAVFKKNVSPLKIHNLIYEQRIYNYMISNLEVDLDATNYNHRHQFALPNQELDLKHLLQKFQQFIKEQYSDKDTPFLEREWRLLFLAFMQPILNGGGYAFKEVQVSQEKRLDIVITYFQHRYVIELKNWYGEKYHKKGLNQIVDYLNIHNLDNGYLVIFDQRKSKNWDSRTIKHQGKSIYAVWV